MIQCLYVDGVFLDQVYDTPISYPVGTLALEWAFEGLARRGISNNALQGTLNTLPQGWAQSLDVLADPRRKGQVVKSHQTASG
jgi:hypothetical protein